MQAWLSMLPPDAISGQSGQTSDRLMTLYAELRQHVWIKTLFTARQNVDLLPLAQTLLSLFDELTQTLLPSMQQSPAVIDEQWQAALEKLTPSARHFLSDEAQLVWSLWKAQLDGNDPGVRRFAQMKQLATAANRPLIWISPNEPTAMERFFLQLYGERQDVWPIMRDWRLDAIHPAYALAWKEIVEFEAMDSPTFESSTDISISNVALFAASSLEDEAVHGAQTIIDWLQNGKSCIAVIAQDREVARRIRALLERAQIYVSDETGWKLSTTRTASAISSLLDVVAKRTDTVALLDFLKSPFVFTDVPQKAALVMLIEHSLRRANVLGGWQSVFAALKHDVQAYELVKRIAEEVHSFDGWKKLAEWVEVTSSTMRALGMWEALAVDAAGAQVINMFETLLHDCTSSAHSFSFAEWRTFIGLQLESSPFIPSDFDRRVVMLQLNGASLRTFDAVLMVGADATHLPSQSKEALFFANAVRRELGLTTRELQHQFQLRDLTELLTVHQTVVLSCQSFTSGEPNAISPWIERLQLTLARAGAPPLPFHKVTLPVRQLPAEPVEMPAPTAPALMPGKLSASAYNSLVACPYQFFVTRMLAISGLDELSDMPEKRHYGDWLHKILTTYHETIRDQQIPFQDRANQLNQISQTIFNEELERNAAALGYFMRWQKAMPAYLEWANERERQGWYFVMGEGKFDKILHWESGRISLHGRIDRIDENADGERAVLDYKTSGLQTLRDRLKSGEDHQLAFYGLLSDLPVSQASYVTLEPLKGKIGAVDAHNYEEWQIALEKNLLGAVQAISQGAPLPANGIERVCQFCGVRGLCRKGAW